MTTSVGNCSVPKPSFEYIDALRGLAISGVVMVHSTGGQAKSSTLLRVLCGHGAMGVQLFFVASAITLMYSQSHRHNRLGRSDWKGFFVRRFFRIAPLFWFGAVFFAWLYGQGSSYWRPNGIQWWFYPLTLGFQHGWMPETINSVVPGGWSVAVEMTFYLMFPVLFRYINSFDRACAFVVFCIVGAFVADQILARAFEGYSPAYLGLEFRKLWIVSQVPIFAIGILTYQVMVRFPSRNRARGYVLLAAALLTFAALLQSSTTLSIIQEHTLFGFGFGVLALALHFHPAPVLVNAVSRHIGVLSFSMYLSHFAVIWFLAYKTTFFTSLPTGVVGVSLGYIVTLLLSTVVSMVTHRWVEKPGIELGKLVNQRLFGSPNVQMQ